MGTLNPRLIHIGNKMNVTLHAVPSNATTYYTIIKGLNFCAPTANATFSIHLLTESTSNTPAANNAILSNVSITKDETIFYDTSIVISPGHSIYISGSNATPVTTMINGVMYG